MADSQEPRAIHLRVMNGPAAGANAEIRGRQAAIGRDPAGDLALPEDASVSRQHATLSWEDDHWVLRDLASKNGTRLLGADTADAVRQPTPVEPGMSFQVGGAEIQIAVLKTPDPEPEQWFLRREPNAIVYEIQTGGSAVQRQRQPVEPARIDEALGDLHALVARANRWPTPETDREFLTLSARMAALLLPRPLRERLAQPTDTPLALLLDPALTALPWEALAVESESLGMRRPVTRQVLLETAAIKSRPLSKDTFRLLIIGNPTSDLPDAQHEAEQLLYLTTEEFGLTDIRFLGGPRARMSAVLEALSKTDAAIYLGHAQHRPDAPRESGWLLADGVLAADALARLETPPGLLIAGACESARESGQAEDYRFDESAAGMAAACLSAGVAQFAGSLWPVPSVSGSALASVLLRELLDGVTLGEGLLRAKRSLSTEAAAGLQAPAAFVAYGHPQSRIRG